MPASPFQGRPPRRLYHRWRLSHKRACYCYRWPIAGHVVWPLRDRPPGQAYYRCKRRGRTGDLGVQRSHWSHLSIGWVLQMMPGSWCRSRGHSSQHRDKRRIRVTGTSPGRQYPRSTTSLLCCLLRSLSCWSRRRWWASTALWSFHSGIVGGAWSCPHPNRPIWQFWGNSFSFTFYL